MNVYYSIVIIIVLAILASYINHRFLKMQPSIAIISTSLAISVLLLIGKLLGFQLLHIDVIKFAHDLHFREILINVLLGLLLFAGALTTEVPHTKQQKWEIGILSTIGVIASALLIGVGVHFVFSMLHSYIPMVYCFLFGALIAPTDPIAVLSILKQTNAPKRLEVLLGGESLFNDGIAVVLFAIIYGIGFLQWNFNLADTISLFLKQTFGGILFGFILGQVACWLIKPVRDYKIITLITIGLVIGGYTFALAINISGALSMVTAGIFIANRKGDIFPSHATEEHIAGFWEIIDELLNAILFFFIGFEVLLMRFPSYVLPASAMIIVVVLLARFIIITTSLKLSKKLHRYPSRSIAILTWGGLRGGLAVALALTIPRGPIKDVILPITYIVVLFSILIQGTTIKWFFKKPKDEQHIQIEDKAT